MIAWLFPAFTWGWVAGLLTMRYIIREKRSSRTYGFDDPTDEEKARITAWVTEERAKAARTPKKGHATPRAPQNVAARRRSLDGRPLRRRLDGRKDSKRWSRPWELAR